MKITATSEVDIQEWDDVVTSVGGSYFHSYAHVVYSAECEEAEPMFIQATDDQGQCVGVATGIIARSHIWPFSQHCNWAMLQGTPIAADVSVEAERLILEGLETYLRRQGVFSIHIFSYDCPRSESVLSSLGYNLSPRSEFYLDLSLSLEEIWSGFKRQRKQNIKKAEKSGVVTRHENTPEALDIISSLQIQSMERHDISIVEAQKRTAPARKKLLESGRIDVLVSYQNDTPINGGYFGTFNDKPYHLVSGSSDVGFKCGGSAHLTWTAIQMYKERGARILNLGATLEGQDTLYRFKKDFGATPISQPIGKKRISAVGSALHRIRSVLRP
jgi:hypothetical protein